MAGCSKCSISHMCEQFKYVADLQKRVEELEKKVEELTKPKREVGFTARTNRTEIIPAIFKETD